MASGGYGAELDELKEFQEKLIRELKSKDLVEAFYKGEVSVKGGELLDKGCTSAENILDFDGAIEVIEGDFKKWKRSFPIIEGTVRRKQRIKADCIKFNGSIISFRELISEEGLCGYYNNKLNWDEMSERYYEGKKIEKPVMCFTIEDYGTIDLRDSESRNTYKVFNKEDLVKSYKTEEEIENIELYTGYDEDEGEDVADYLQITTKDRGYSINIREDESTVCIDDYTSVGEAENCMLLADLDILEDFISADVSADSYYSYDNNRIYFYYIPEETNGFSLELLKEVSPMVGCGYKWSDAHSCKNLAKVINDRLKVDAVLDGSPGLYKVYMNGNLPEIKDEVSGKIIDYSSNQWFYTLLINEILKLNKNIGVAYLVYNSNRGEIKGNYRARKDKNTGEYVVTIW